MGKATATSEFILAFWQLVEAAHKELCYWDILKECQRFIIDLVIKSEVEYHVKGGT